MNGNIVYGPSVPLIQEQLGLYIFNKLKHQDGSRVLIINSSTNEEFTVNDININSIKLALVLRKYIKRGDIIAAIAENHHAFILPLLASIYLGTTIAFINPVYNPHELRQSLSNLNPKFIFCSLGALNNLTQIEEEIKEIQEIILVERESINGFRTLENFINSGCNITDIGSFRPVDVQNDNDTAIILSSSGTTGVPKGVNVTYRNLISHMPFLQHKDYLNMVQEDIIILILPIFHVFGLLLLLFSVIFSYKTVIMKRFKPDLFLSSLQKYRVSKLIIVPPLATFLAKNKSVYDYDLSSIKDIICGAAPLGQSILKQIYERLNVPVRQLYGLTETAGITCAPPGLITKVNTVGRVTSNTQIAIKDMDTRQILPVMQRGEICVKGPIVMKGYFCNEEATKNSFDSDGYFLTGDVGYFDEDGYLFIVDRIKELIKYKGFQVAPAELEDILIKHEAVQDVAVVGIPDEAAGELPTAFVVRRPNVVVTEDVLAKFVAAQVSNYKQLSGGVLFVDEIPKSPSGKILKKKLKENFIKE